MLEDLFKRQSNPLALRCTIWYFIVYSLCVSIAQAKCPLSLYPAVVHSTSNMHMPHSEISIDNGKSAQIEISVTRDCTLLSAELEKYNQEMIECSPIHFRDIRGFRVFPSDKAKLSIKGVSKDKIIFDLDRKQSGELDIYIVLTIKEKQAKIFGDNCSNFHPCYQQCQGISTEEGYTNKEYRLNLKVTEKDKSSSNHLIFYIFIGLAVLSILIGITIIVVYKNQPEYQEFPSLHTIKKIKAQQIEESGILGYQKSLKEGESS